MAVLAVALGHQYERAGSREDGLWRMMAFAAKYGKTHPGVTRDMTVPDLAKFNRAVGQIMEEEAEATRAAAEAARNNPRG